MSSLTCFFICFQPSSQNFLWLLATISSSALPYYLAGFFCVTSVNGGELPLVENQAADFQAEAVSHQEFIKLSNASLPLLAVRSIGRLFRFHFRYQAGAGKVADTPKKMEVLML